MYGVQKLSVKYRAYYADSFNAPKSSSVNFQCHKHILIFYLSNNQLLNCLSFELQKVDSSVRNYFGAETWVDDTQYYDTQHYDPQ